MNRETLHQWIGVWIMAVLAAFTWDPNRVKLGVVFATLACGQMFSMAIPPIVRWCDGLKERFKIRWLSVLLAWIPMQASAILPVLVIGGAAVLLGLGAAAIWSKLASLEQKQNAKKPDINIPFVPWVAVATVPPTVQSPVTEPVPASPELMAAPAFAPAGILLHIKIECGKVVLHVPMQCDVYSSRDLQSWSYSGSFGSTTNIAVESDGPCGFFMAVPSRP